MNYMKNLKISNIIGKSMKDFALKKFFLVKRKHRYNRSLNFRNWCTGVRRNRAIEMHNNLHYCLETMFIVLDTQLDYIFHLRETDENTFE